MPSSVPLGAKVDDLSQEEEERDYEKLSIVWVVWWEEHGVCIFLLLNIAVHLGLFFYAPRRLQVCYFLIGSPVVW